MFFYEHIGHMQFSVLTLYTYQAVNDLTDGKIDFFVSWDEAQAKIEAQGFSKKLAYGELDRFCYGFECLDRYINGKRQIALTKIGKLFLDYLLKEAPAQSSQLAFLGRPAKKKNHWNVIVQESTFFNQEIYDLIAEYKFRKGGARDFLKCLSNEDLLEFLTKAMKFLSIMDRSKKFFLSDCINQVEKNGKYWASVGGKYSWYVYPQKFVLPFDEQDWESYDLVIEKMIRPPEWGGGLDLHYSDFLKLVKTEDRFVKFRKAGIIRPIWNSDNIRESFLRITSPGYLMHERKKKGFIFEFFLKRNQLDLFDLYLCNADDFPNVISKSSNFKNSNDIPSLLFTADKENIIKNISKIINQQLPLF